MKRIHVGFKRGLHRRAFLALIATTGMLTVFGCVSADVLPSDFPDTPTPSATNPYQEIYDAGLTKYVGQSLVRPSSVTEIEVTPPIDVWNFPKSDTGRGPLCMGGNDFFIETRDGTSNDLLIYLQMGGVCLNEICAATPNPILNLQVFTLGNLIGMGGILNHSDSRNPMANYNVVHIPYCDGALFMGDVDRVLQYGGTSVATAKPAMAYQRGLQNLTAGFEVAKMKYPNPSRIVLAGSSGGSYGIMAGTALARLYYPDTPLLTIADSGAPMGRDNDKDFIRVALTELNAIQYIPLASCPDCIANGHVTKVIDWALQRDPTLQVASMSHADDAIIGTFFMQSPPPIFRDALVTQTESLSNWGSRVHSFITPGTQHTYLLDIWVPSLMQEVLMGTFGWVVFNGANADPITEFSWSLGDLSTTAIDQGGYKVDGFQWLTNLINDPSTLQNVLNLE